MSYILQHINVFEHCVMYWTSKHEDIIHINILLYSLKTFSLITPSYKKIIDEVTTTCAMLMTCWGYDIFKHYNHKRMFTFFVRYVWPVLSKLFQINKPSKIIMYSNINKILNRFLPLTFWIIYKKQPMFPGLIDLFYNVYLRMVNFLLNGDI